MRIPFLIDRYHIKYNKYYSKKIHNHIEDYLKKIIKRKQLIIDNYKVVPITLHYWEDVPYTRNGTVFIYTKNKKTIHFFKRYESVFLVNEYFIDIVSDY